LARGVLDENRQRLATQLVGQVAQRHVLREPSHEGTKYQGIDVVVEAAGGDDAGTWAVVPRGSRLPFDADHGGGERRARRYGDVRFAGRRRRHAAGLGTRPTLPPTGFLVVLLSAPASCRGYQET